jgi:putative ABC transport system permease protein
VAAFEWNTPSTQQALTQLDAGRFIIANGIYSAQNKVTLGERLTMDTPNGPRTYFVAGIGNDYLNAKLATIYVSQANLAADFNITSDLLIMANRVPSADPAVTRAKLDSIVSQYPAFKLYAAAEWRDSQTSIFDQTYVVFYVLVAALALPSLLALINTLAISVLARTREIGMLRAVGSTRRQIRRMVMAESLLLSAIGTAFGIVAGLFLGYALVLAMSSVGWPMPYFLGRHPRDDRHRHDLRRPGGAHPRAQRSQAKRRRRAALRVGRAAGALEPLEWRRRARMHVRALSMQRAHVPPREHQ